MSIHVEWFRDPKIALYEAGDEVGENCVDDDKVAFALWNDECAIAEFDSWEDAETWAHLLLSAIAARRPDPQVIVACDDNGNILALACPHEDCPGSTDRNTNDIVETVPHYRESGIRKGHLVVDDDGTIGDFDVEEWLCGECACRSTLPAGLDVTYLSEVDDLETVDSPVVTKLLG